MGNPGRGGLVVLALAASCGGGGSGGWAAVAGGPAAPASFGVVDVWAFAPDDVWFVDGSTSVWHYDGASFEMRATPATAGLTCVYGLATNDVYMCAGGQILRWDGADFTTIDVVAATGVDGLIGIWAESPTELWAISDGTALAAHLVGQTWETSNTGATFASSIWGSGPDDVYVLGTFDLMHWDGMGWTAVTLDAGAGDGQVWGTGQRDVWVMPDSSTLSHFDGDAWQAVELDDAFVGDLAAVWGPTSDDLWAVGSAGAIAHYDGTTWRQVSHQAIGAPYLRVFVAVHGSAPDDVWAVGQQLGEGGSTPIIWRYTP
jgi:hypothetical protein